MLPSAHVSHTPSPLLFPAPGHREGVIGFVLPTLFTRSQEHFQFIIY